MSRNLAERFIHQSQIAGHVSGRDTTKRLTTAALITWICLLAGFTTEVILVATCLICVELIAYPLNKRASAFDKPIDMQIAMGVFLANWIGMLPFLAFSLILSQSTVLPFILAGYIWAFAIFVHVTNSFGLLPLYNWSHLTSAFAAVFWMLWNLSNNARFEAEMTQWLIVAALMFVYIVNTLDTMTRQKDTHSALARARKEAHARLAELEHLTRNDDLTNLMNRRAFDGQLKQQMDDSREKFGVTVFLIDLDGFKAINDIYSHKAGDAVLIATADRLRDLARQYGGKAARLGGDEFAIIRPNISDAEQARAFGSTIAVTLHKPISFEEVSLTISASVGIAMQSQGIMTPAELLSGADQAMFVAKSQPDSAAVLYNKHALPQRHSLDDRNTLLAAMRENEITPFYQPKTCINTGKIIGFEALSRWQHPQRGLLFPASFIPLINDLSLQGEFMIHTTQRVLDDIEQWRSEGLDPGQVSVNLSEVSLATISGRDQLLELITRHGDVKHHLTFEITEDVFISRSADIVQKSIRMFRAAGIRISLDDFGTGFASFQHLRELAFDELKLDTTFVHDLGTDPAATVLIDGFLNIGEGLGVQVIAEGVERKQQLELLRGMGCQFVQGHYFGAAMPFSETLLRLTVGDTMQAIARTRQTTAA